VRNKQLRKCRLFVPPRDPNNDNDDEEEDEDEDDDAEPDDDFEPAVVREPDE
jgi:hypothetical protein